MEVPDYKSILNYIETENCIKNINGYFEANFARELNLISVSAPMFLPINNEKHEGDFIKIKLGENDVKLVDSLVEWKRNKLNKCNFQTGSGIYTNAVIIKPNQIVSNVSSFSLKEFSFEKVILKTERNLHTLKGTVKKIFKVFKSMERYLFDFNERLTPQLPNEITFTSSLELEKLYPNAKPKEREFEFGKKKKAFFMTKVSIKLKNDEIHEPRRGDYDDWQLNGNLFFYFPKIKNTLKVGSLGIRVDADSLKKQMISLGDDTTNFNKFQKDISAGALPPSLGGVLNSSRLIMYFLHKIHIGEVECNIWPPNIIEASKNQKITLLN